MQASPPGMSRLGLLLRLQPIPLGPHPPTTAITLVMLVVITGRARDPRAMQLSVSRETSPIWGRVGGGAAVPPPGAGPIVAQLSDRRRLSLAEGQFVSL